ncbi:MAG: hypothetical protein R6V58_13365 [Planctomycetota bacterium]
MKKGRSPRTLLTENFEEMPFRLCRNGISNRSVRAKLYERGADVIVSSLTHDSRSPLRALITPVNGGRLLSWGKPLAPR